MKWTEWTRGDQSNPSGCYYSIIGFEMDVKKHDICRMSGSYVVLKCQPDPGRKLTEMRDDATTLFKLWVIISHSKHETSIQCCTNVGPPSTTLAQHWSNIGGRPMSYAYLERASTTLNFCCAMLFWKTSLWLPLQQNTIKENTK